MSSVENAEPEHEPLNPFVTFFFIAGPALMLVGLAGAVIAFRTANDDASSARLDAAVEGYGVVPLSPDLTFMWVFVVVGVIGLALLATGLGIRAARR